MRATLVVRELPRARCLLQPCHGSDAQLLLELSHAIRPRVGKLQHFEHALRSLPTLGRQAGKVVQFVDLGIDLGEMGRGCAS